VRGWRPGAWGAGRARALARATSPRPTVEGSEGRFVAGMPAEPHHHKDTVPPLPSRRYRPSPQQETYHTAEPLETRERGEVCTSAA